MIDVIKTVLTVVGTIIAAWLVYKGQKFITRSSTTAAATNREQAWNDRYRAAGEQHTNWDYKMLRAMERMQDQFNELERALGRAETEWPPLEDPPPLFPKPE